MRAPIAGFFILAFLFTLSVSAQAQYQQAPKKAPAGDVEYNATEKSPTLPLVQTPPPQNSPNSVYVGQPNYYYYYPMSYGGYGSGYGPGYGAVPQVGGIVTNTGSQSRRTFWFSTPIPGQVAPSPSYGTGPAFYGPGYFPYAGSNGVFIP